MKLQTHKMTSASTGASHGGESLNVAASIAQGIDNPELARIIATRRSDESSVSQARAMGGTLP
jgi:hypothetical protein